MKYLLLKVFEGVIDGIEINENEDVIKSRFYNYTKINFEQCKENTEILGYFKGTYIYVINENPYILIQMYKALVDNIFTFETEDEAIDAFEAYTGVVFQDYVERKSTQETSELLNDFDQTSIFENEKLLA